ncbi:hypothetical protein L6452_02436 [Arctium lappa]|uniref:Uncharacterized protein n=1 Tax=Arctium lappa TaxID=4217 RepID=A0ACB9FJX3_ARCLA|nr:hypothetical protein L6452_02436 [Arctium lappa]
MRQRKVLLRIVKRNLEYTELKSKISDLEAQIVKLKEKDCVKKNEEIEKGLESANIKDVEKDFEEERKIFETEIKKLTKKLSELSTKGHEIAEHELQKMMFGSKVGNQMKVANYINNYEEFKAKENESLEDTYERFVLLLNELSKNKVKKQQIENNNEEEVEEKRSEKKKVEKAVDPIALVGGENDKEKKEKKKKKKIVISSLEYDSESDGDDRKNLKQAMLLLTLDFQKKFYNKPGSNSQRYSSSGLKNYEHRERIEGKKYEEKRYVEKKPDAKKKYVNDYTSTEKKADDLIK